MAIVDIQRGITEAGRIRIGQKVAGGRPSRLETFRLTSADKLRIEQAAALYGGEVSAWEAPAGAQWQVVTKATSLDVIVPPSDLSFSQHYELWSAGGAQRRCDGVTEVIGDRACVCDPNDRECDIHTRLSVMLRDLPGFGVWRIDTQGWYAARELAGAVHMIQLAAGRGALLPARLRLEQRSVKRTVKGKVQTQRFPVPVLDIEITPAQLLAGGAQPVALIDAARSPLTPVPAQLASTPSIAEQSAPPAERAPRKNAAPEIPASGRRRGTAPLPVEVATAPARTETPDDRPDRPPDFSGLPGRQQATEAAPARKRSTKKAEDDPDYWPTRVHAAAGEHDIDHDGVRVIGAAIAQVAAAEVAEWSSRNLTAEQWGKVDAIVRDLPKPLDEEAASKWLWAIAAAKGFVKRQEPEKGWEQLDGLAVVVYRVPADDLTPAQWVALGLRIVAGEYDKDAAP